jgi:hypothetical protein
MTRPVRPFHHTLQAAKIKPQYRRTWIHFFHGRNKKGCAPRWGQHLGVGFWHAGVEAKVVGVVELCGVDKNADHYLVALGTRGFNQLNVACVQGAHCGHQAHAFSGLSGLFGVSVQPGDGGKYLHR